MMIVGTIVLIGVAWLNQAANCNSLAFDYGSLDEFAKSPNNQGRDTDQVRQLLLRGNSGDKIGQTTVGELLRLDAIQVEHCNMVGLDICIKVEDDKDLARFCQNRLDELAKFCAGRLDQVIDAEMKKRVGKNPRVDFEHWITQATKSIKGEQIDDIRPSLKHYIRTTSIPFTKCFKFLKAMKSTEAILERSGDKFADLVRHNGSLFDLFLIYELCQAQKELKPEKYEALLKEDLEKQ